MAINESTLPLGRPALQPLEELYERYRNDAVRCPAIAVAQQGKLLATFADDLEAILPALQAALAQQEDPGTPTGRFIGLLDQLERRCPDPQPAAAAPYELRFLAWLDAQTAQLAQQETEKAELEQELVILHNTCGRYEKHIYAAEARAARAEAQRDRLRNALVQLVGSSDRAELEAMEVVLRLSPAPAEDKAAAIDGVHALLALLAADPAAPAP